MLVHELVHALQFDVLGADRWVALEPEKWPDEIDLEPHLAARAVQEGQAQMIAEQVGRALGIGDPHADLRAKGRPDMAWTAQLREFHPALAVQDLFDLVYASGLQYARTRYAEGGAAAVWDALAEPPRASAEILDPGTSPRPRERPTRLGPIEDALGPGWSSRFSLRFGALLASVFFLDRQSSLGSFSHGWLRYANSEEGGELTLLALVTKPERRASDLLDEVRRSGFLGRSQAAETDPAGRWVGWEDTPAAARWIPESGQAGETRVRYAEGRVILILSLEGSEPPERHLLRYLQKAAGRMVR